MSTSSVRFSVLCLLALAAATPACASESAPSSEENMTANEAFDAACASAKTLLVGEGGDISKYDPKDPTVQKKATDIAKGLAAGTGEWTTKVFSIRDGLVKAAVADKSPGDTEAYLAYRTPKVVGRKVDTCGIALAQSGATLAYAVEASKQHQGDPATEKSCSARVPLADLAYASTSVNPDLKAVVKDSTWAEPLRTALADNIVLTLLMGTERDAEKAPLFRGLKGVRFVALRPNNTELIEFRLTQAANAPNEGTFKVRARAFPNAATLEGTWKDTLGSAVELSFSGETTLKVADHIDVSEIESVTFTKNTHVLVSPDTDVPSNEAPRFSFRLGNTQMQTSIAKVTQDTSAKSSCVIAGKQVDVPFGKP